MNQFHRYLEIVVEFEYIENMFRNKFDCVQMEIFLMEPNLSAELRYGEEEKDKW